jgi:hypothetical protein
MSTACSGFLIAPDESSASLSVSFDSVGNNQPLTVAIFVKEAECFLEFRDLFFRQLVSHGDVIRMGSMRRPKSMRRCVAQRSRAPFWINIPSGEKSGNGSHVELLLSSTEEFGHWCASATAIPNK